MDFKVEIGRLSQDELVYELKIRGITSELTVDVMRSTLRELKKLEPSSGFIPPTYPFSYADDKASIELKLLELEPIVENFADLRTSPSFRQISSKIAHLLARTSKSQPTTEEEKASR